MTSYSTRPATAAENAPVLTPLPPPRVPQIDYREHPVSPIQAYPASERGKFVCPAEDPMIAWHVVGTDLEATITMDGREYRLECETIASLDNEVIEQISSWVYEGKRLIRPEDAPGLYRDVRESADEAVDKYAVALLEMWAEERGEQRAESVRDEEGMCA